MKKFAIAALGTAALYLVATGKDAPLGAPSRALAVAPAPDTLSNSVIQTVCTRCHNDSRRAGNRSFLEFDATAPEADPETARAFRQLYGTPDTNLPGVGQRDGRGLVGWRHCVD